MQTHQFDNFIEQHDELISNMSRKYSTGKHNVVNDENDFRQEAHIKIYNLFQRYPDQTKTDAFFKVVFRSLHFRFIDIIRKSNVKVIKIDDMLLRKARSKGEREFAKIFNLPTFDKPIHREIYFLVLKNYNLNTIALRLAKHLTNYNLQQRKVIVKYVISNEMIPLLEVMRGQMVGKRTSLLNFKYITRGNA